MTDPGVANSDTSTRPDEAAQDFDLINRTMAFEALPGSAWRLTMSALRLSLLVDSWQAAMAAATVASAAAGADADEHLRLDVRPDRVEFCVQTIARDWLTTADPVIAARIEAALVAAGFTRFAPTGEGAEARPTQVLEFAIDAIDIAAVRPFWKAVLDFVDKPGDHPVYGGLVDPVGQLPQVWFQQMDSPRDQRNRIHFDLAVAHDEAQRRIAAGLAAGGRIVYRDELDSWCVLADPEGNEVCVCSWVGRDERGW